MPNYRLTKQMFNSDYMLENNNWSTCHIFFITIGKVDSYDNKSECDITCCEQKLYELFENVCKSTILSHPQNRNISPEHF